MLTTLLSRLMSTSRGKEEKPVVVVMDFIVKQVLIEGEKCVIEVVLQFVLCGIFQGSVHVEGSEIKGTNGCLRLCVNLRRLLGITRKVSRSGSTAKAMVYISEICLGREGCELLRW